MIIVRDDDELLRYAEQMLKVERQSAQHVRTVRDIAVSRTRVQLAEEFVNLIDLHVRQAKMPKKDFQL